MTLTLKQQASIASREKILAAAAEVITQHGTNGFTLDAVARQAGISKGGLLHHFASKEALLEGLLTNLFDQFSRAVASYYERESDAPGRWLRAYVRATFDAEALSLEISAAMLAGIMESEHIHELIALDTRSWTGVLTGDGLTWARVQAVRMACDGLWTEAFVNQPLSEGERAALRDELLSLAGAQSS